MPASRWKPAGLRLQWLLATVLTLLLLPVAAADDFAAVAKLATTRAKSGTPQQRIDVLDQLSRFATPEAADLIVRIGFSSKDPLVRAAAEQALGATLVDGDVRQHLLKTLARELQKPVASLAPGLATAFLAAEPDEAAADLTGWLATQPDPKRVEALCWSVATAAVERGDAKAVTILSRLAGLPAFQSHFSFRRGIVRALIATNSPEGVAALIDILPTLPGEVRADLVNYLCAISGKNFGTDAVAWEEWWRTSREGFRFPPRQLAYAAAPAAGVENYYDIPLYAERLVFVLDTSQSMAGPRLEAAKRELVSAIFALPPAARFTVVAFNSSATAWQKQLTPASDPAKQAAAEFVSRQQPDGKTASFDALEAAFTFDTEAVYFLSDGNPTTGKIIDPAAIVRYVSEANKLRRVSVHTIGVMPDGNLADFLQTLARTNYGFYRHVAE